MQVFEHRTTVTFGQVDAAAIVFYPRYHEMLSDTVEAWFAQALGAPYHEMHARDGCGVPIVSSSCEFLRASRLGDALVFSLRLTAVGRSSFSCAIEASGGGERRLTAAVRHAYVRLRPLASMPIPEPIRARMRPYLSPPVTPPAAAGPATGAAR